MTRTEHLLIHLAEESTEVAQRATKALRFGLAEVQPGQTETNAERIAYELDDLQAIVSMLQLVGVLPMNVNHTRVAEKVAKVEKYLLYAAECGTLD